MKGKSKEYFNYGRDMGTNPAKVNLDTGEISLNPLLWDSLSSEERIIILNHEKGHLVNDNANESEADKYLIDKYGVTTENLIKIAKTISKFIANDEKSTLRKKELLKNLLAKSQELEVNEREAYWTQWALPLAESLFNIGASIMPSLFPTKSAWQNMKMSQKRALIESTYFEEAYKTYKLNSGNWNSVISSHTKNLNKVWQTFAKNGLFENGNSQVDMNPNSFFQSNGGVDINSVKQAIESRYSQEPMISKFISSYVFRILAIGLIAFILFKLITRKK